jgi:hypothetical protein
MEYTLYPYLVTKSLYTDYNTVVCPSDFFMPTQFSLATEKIKPGEVGIRKMVGSKRDFFIVYTSEKLLRKDLENESLKDEFGRPIYMDYGFVIDSIENIPIGELLKASKNYLQPHLDKFLETKRGFSTIRGDKILYTGIKAADNYKNVVRLQDYTLPAEKTETIVGDADPKGKTKDCIYTGSIKKSDDDGEKRASFDHGNASSDGAGCTYNSSGNKTTDAETPPKTNSGVTAGKIVATAVLGIGLVDGIMNLRGDKSKASEPLDHGSVFIRVVEISAAIAGIVLVWKSKAINNLFQSLFKNGQKYR